jgi:hypothetical protein
MSPTVEEVKKVVDTVKTPEIKNDVEPIKQEPTIVIDETKPIAEPAVVIKE